MIEQYFPAFKCGLVILTGSMVVALVGPFFTSKDIVNFLRVSQSIIAITQELPRAYLIFCIKGLVRKSLGEGGGGNMGGGHEDF